jgi:hypothetical protein
MVFVRWAPRRVLQSMAGINILRRWILRRRRRRKKYIVAWSAQLLSVGSEASGDAIGVWYVGPAEPKHIRCAGMTLLLGPLSGRGCLNREKKYKCGDTAGYLIGQHTVHPQVRAGDVCPTSPALGRSSSITFGVRPLNAAFGDS